MTSRSFATAGFTVALVLFVAIAMWYNSDRSESVVVSDREVVYNQLPVRGDQVDYSTGTLELDGATFVYQEHLLKVCDGQDVVVWDASSHGNFHVTSAGCDTQEGVKWTRVTIELPRRNMKQRMSESWSASFAEGRLILRRS